MKKIYVLFLFLIYNQNSYSQVFINELDSDTPSTDVMEFVELKSIVPNFSLDDYVLVFYNGNNESTTGNKSYFSISLTGITTDSNGIALVGNSQVSPYPDKVFFDSTIENGADAVALYLGNALQFPKGTLAHQNNLIDVLFHHTSDPQPTVLMNLLGGTVQYNETATTSIQRKSDGTFENKTPTPGRPNDGSGVVYNNITVSTPQQQYNEGDNFILTFTTQFPVTEDITFNYSLINDTFNTSDYEALTTVSIPSGSTTFTTNVLLVNDHEDEGDEVLKIRFGVLPEGYKRGNDNYTIDIIDDDIGTSTYGTPLNPTYGIVSSTAPTGYYSTLEGLSGNSLKMAIQAIIADSTVVRAHSYGDVFEILKMADRNPENHNHIWMMYKEQTRSKLLMQTTGSGAGKWNREHIYPQSRGGFTDGTSDDVDGINIWEVANATRKHHGHSDAHHIRAEDNQENSSRNNRNFGLTGYNGFNGNQGSWKGDVARALFYMAVRYNGLDVVNGSPQDNIVGQIGDLTTLLNWNNIDPSDDFEMNRNNYIYTWQYNRNPFIDYPDLADYIWGANVGQPWYSSLSVENPIFTEIQIFPNPTRNKLNFTGIKAGDQIYIYNINGQLVLQSVLNINSFIEFNLPSGIYITKINSSDKTFTKKLIIE